MLSSAHWIGRHNQKIFHQPQLIFALASAKLYRIHAFAHEVQTETSRLYIIEIAALQLLSIDRDSAAS